MANNPVTFRQVLEDLSWESDDPATVAAAERVLHPSSLLSHPEETREDSLEVLAEDHPDNAAIVKAAKLALSVPVELLLDIPVTKHPPGA